MIDVTSDERVSASITSKIKPPGASKVFIVNDYERWHKAGFEIKEIAIPVSYATNSENNFERRVEGLTFKFITIFT